MSERMSATEAFRPGCHQSCRSSVHPVPCLTPLDATIRCPRQATCDPSPRAHVVALERIPDVGQARQRNDTKTMHPCCCVGTGIARLGEDMRCELTESLQVLAQPDLNTHSVQHYHTTGAFTSQGFSSCNAVLRSIECPGLGTCMSHIMRQPQGGICQMCRLLRRSAGSSWS